MVLTSMLSFLLLLNPFAMFIYLSPVMKDLTHRDFVKVLIKASIMSFAIYVVFALTGNLLFRSVFNISFASFQIFGGIVIFSMAYLFIIKGQRALIQMTEDLDDLASEIALPFMVGAATISFVIIMSEQFGSLLASGLVAATLCIYALFILGLKYIRDHIKRKKIQVAFDKNMEILLRLNGFFLGAIGIDLTITGIKAVFF